MKYVKNNIVINRSEIPSLLTTPEGTLGSFRDRPIEVLNTHGYFEYKEPEEFNPETQYKTDLIKVENYYTHTVVDKTPDQLQTDAIAYETGMYKQRISDGTNMFAKLSAEIRLSKQAGAVTQEQDEVLYDMTRVLRSDILAGQWKTGLVTLEALEDAMFNNEVLGELGGSTYTMLYHKIYNYILENYD